MTSRGVCGMDNSAEDRSQEKSTEPRCCWPSKELRNEHPELLEDYECPHTAKHQVGDKYYCIFHLPLEEKRRDPALAEEFERAFDCLFFFTDDRDFSGFEFPDKSNFDEWDFSLQVKVGDNTDGQQKRYRPSVFFTLASFGDEVSFFQTIFGDGVSFFNASFKGQSNFFAATFSKIVYFGSVEFKGFAVFEHVTFGAYTLFRSATFQEVVSFDGATFREDVRFHSTTFRGKSSFENVVFGDNSVFLGATFERETTFSGSTFGGDLAFGQPDGKEKAIFENKSSFTLAVFQGAVRFYHGVFKGDTSFEGADFWDTAIFVNAIFMSEAVFINARFGEVSRFDQAEFYKSVNFAQIGGWKRTRNLYVNSMNDKDEKASRHKGTAQWAPPDLSFHQTKFHGAAYFQTSDLSKTLFQQVNLRYVSFFLSKISETRFISCEWGSGFENPKGYLSCGGGWVWPRWLRPRMLFDEILLRKHHLNKKSIILIPRHKLEEEIEEKSRRIKIKATEIQVREEALKEYSVNPAGKLPRWVEHDLSKLSMERRGAYFRPSDIESEALQLKESLERTKDPIPAGDFHFSAMEMKRYQAKDQGRLGPRFGLWWYKILNGYGVRPGRAFVWFISTIVLSFVLFITWGDKCLWQAIFASLAHSLPLKAASTASRLGNGSNPADWIGLGETIVGTSLFSLFLLALRSRFRR